MPSTVQKTNLEPISNILATQLRDFALTDPTLSDPLNALALVDGEWMVIDSNYKIVRAASVATAGNLATQHSYPLFAERGRYDVRAQSGAKMPIIFLGPYEADTRIFDAASTAGGAAITTVGQPLAACSITIGSRVYCGLVGGTSSSVIVGRVTRLPANNGGKLRFVAASTI